MIADASKREVPAASDVDQTLLGLLQRIAAREVRALDSLYELTVDRLFALANKIAGDVRDAEEVIADVYHYVWEHATEFDAQRGSVMAWLSMLSWSRASDRRRRRKPELSFDPLHPIAAPTVYTECEDEREANDLDAFVDGHRVRQALSGLRAEQRRLILMAFFEGASHGEIAARTGMPLGTINSHIRRGMDSLRASLQGALAHGG